MIDAYFCFGIQNAANFWQIRVISCASSSSFLHTKILKKGKHDFGFDLYLFPILSLFIHLLLVFTFYQVYTYRDIYTSFSILLCVYLCCESCIFMTYWHSLTSILLILYTFGFCVCAFILFTRLHNILTACFLTYYPRTVQAIAHDF